MAVPTGSGGRFRELSTARRGSAGPALLNFCRESPATTSCLLDRSQYQLQTSRFPAMSAALQDGYHGLSELLNIGHISRAPR